MYLATNSDYVLSQYQTCKHCKDEGSISNPTPGHIVGITGFFLSDAHLKTYIKRYKPDLLKVRDIDLRNAITELVKGVERNG
jgi:hypothetical protein